MSRFHQENQPYGIDREYWTKLSRMFRKAMGPSGERVGEVAHRMLAELDDQSGVGVREIETALRELLFASVHASFGFQPSLKLTDQEIPKTVNRTSTPAAAFQTLVTNYLYITRDRGRIERALAHIGITRHYTPAFFRGDLDDIIDDALRYSRGGLRTALTSRELDRGQAVGLQPFKMAATASVIEAATKRAATRIGISTTDGTGNMLDGLSQQQLNALADAVDQELRR